MISDFRFFSQIIPGSESRSVEAVCWQGSRLFSAGLDGNVTGSEEIKTKGLLFCLHDFLKLPLI